MNGTSIVTIARWIGRIGRSATRAGLVILILASLAFGSAPCIAQGKIVTRNSAVSRPRPLSTSTGVLNLVCGTTGRVGEPFDLATATGGNAPYTFTGIPSGGGVGVTFNSPADQQKGIFVVQNHPYTAGGTANFNVTARDKNGISATTTCSINIIAATPGALAIGCPGTANPNVAFVIANVSGGTKPYTYSAPQLPPPLTLDSTTGVITGASTGGTIDAITITVKDSGGSQASKACKIHVSDDDDVGRKGWLKCSFFPVANQSCVGSGVARNTNVNTFWGTNGGFVFFNQIQSIYNGASNSETVSAQIGTLNFPVGLEVNIGTNIQTGSVIPTAVSTGATPTLLPSAAAQAAQDMLYGGTIYASGAYPLFAIGGNRISSPGGWGGMLDVYGREGVDTQSFKAGTSTGLTNPSTHSGIGIEGYAQMNSSNLPTGGGGTFAGALFLGGSYGYSYTSHQFIRDYGMAKPSNSLSQVSAGILINGVAKLAFSKAWGPAQTYFDGTLTPTPSSPTTINNFKTWSFELSYQSAPAGSK